MFAPILRIDLLYQRLPSKKAKETYNTIMYVAKMYFARLAERFQEKSSMAVQELETLFDQADDLLNHRLDNLMKIFVNRNPNFYNGYQKARVIVDY